MSKLDKLLRELCPNGVEYKRIGDFAMCFPGATPKTTHPEYWENGTIPWMSSGEVNQEEVTFTEKKITPKGYDETSTKMVPVGTVVIALAGQGKTRGKVAITRIPLCTNQSLCAIVVDETVISKYLFHYLRSQYARIREISSGDGTRGGLNLKMIKAYVVPVPPIEVQEEIVRILDSYTEKIDELTQNLMTEITARNTQYGYYRDKLLTPKDDVVVETLGNICRFVRGPFGGALKKEIFKPTGYAVYEQQHAIYRKLEFRYYIDKQKYEELKRFAVHPGEMIVSCSGTIGKTFVIPENAPEGVINQALLKLTPTNRINVFYLQYFFDNTISKILNSVARGGAIKNVPSVEELKAIKIPIPTLEVQQRLVEVLDNFEKICSDLNIGLPAEIEARQKQYEYYRDKLLTFAETGNTILSRAEQSRAEQSRAEQSRAEQSRALIKLLQYVFGYAMLPLSEVANVFRGEYITKKNENAGNIPVILGGQEPAYYIDRANHIGEIVAVARSGASAGFVSYWNEPIFITDGFGYEAKKEVVAPRYLYYVLKNKEAELNGMKRGAGVPHVSGERLGEINLPVPPIEEQKRVVSILDRFDAICNDLTSGLPAEIEARQRQYEYYRDKLLTFKERG